MSSLSGIAEALQEARSALESAMNKTDAAAELTEALAGAAEAMGLAASAHAASGIVEGLRHLIQKLQKALDEVASISDQVQALRDGRASARSRNSPANLIDERTTSSGVLPRVDAWSTGQARRAWVRAQLTDPVTSKPVPSGADWAVYQRQVAGTREVRLFGGGRDIWADGLAVDPDTVVAAEAKFVTRPGRSLYEGDLPPALAEELLAPFDSEMHRYAAVINDPNNPVRRLRLVTSTPKAAQFLGDRARRILGSGIDLQILHIPPKNS